MGGKAWDQGLLSRILKGTDERLGGMSDDVMGRQQFAPSGEKACSVAVFRARWDGHANFGKPVRTDPTRFLVYWDLLGGGHGNHGRLW